MRRILPAVLATLLIAAIFAAGCTAAPPPPPGPAPTASPGSMATTVGSTPAATLPGATPSSPTASPTATATPTGTPVTTPTAAASPTDTATVTATTTVTTAARPSATATVTTTVTPTPTASSSSRYTEPELKYLLLDRYGEDRFFFCDPDVYPVSHGDEHEKALAAFPAIENDTAEFTAITERTGRTPPFTDDDRLAIYREHKRLRAIPLTPVTADAYMFSIAIGTEGEGRRVSGVIRGDGAITGERTEPAVLTCPICLAEGTRIDTPSGPVRVDDLREGMPVWTVDAGGNRVASSVRRTATTKVPPAHRVVHLRLSDGREVTASPGHPTADGRPIGHLRVGDRLDGATVSSAETVPYGGTFVYDLRPSGPTGRYWAEGVLLGSTLP